MAAMVEMHHTGCVPVVRAEIVAVIDHMLADRPGDWRVSIIGSQANDRWEMKIMGPNAFERSYSLEGSAGEHEPHVIGKLVARMVPGGSLERKFRSLRVAVLATALGFLGDRHPKIAAKSA